MAKNKLKALIIDRQRSDGIFRGSFFSYILKKEKKIESLVITDSKNNSASVDLYKKLGLAKFLFINKETYNLKNFFLLLISFFFTLNFLFKFLFYKKKFKVSKFTIKDILIGDLMLDQLIRYNKNDYLTKFNLIILGKLVYSTIFKILFLKNFIDQNKIKFLITTSYSYMSLSSLGIRVILKSKGKVIMIAGGSYQIFSNYKECLTGFSSPSELNIKNIRTFIKDKKNMSKVDDYFKKRINYQNNKKIKKLSPYEMEIFKAYSKKNYTKNELYKILKFDNIKKPMCVFGLHAFRDANHLYGDLMFESFFDEFLETINYLNNKNNFYWVFKIHPYSQRYREENLAYNLIKKKGLKNIHLFPDYISTKSILLAADKLVTSRGTIAVEFASIGKMPIVTADSYYNKYGITIHAKNKKQYFKMLLDQNYPINLSDKKKDLAKTVLFIIKNIAANDNKYNFTKPEREIGNKNFLRDIDKNIVSISRSSSSFYKKYIQILEKI